MQEVFNNPDDLLLIRVNFTPQEVRQFESNEIYRI